MSTNQQTNVLPCLAGESNQAFTTEDMAIHAWNRRTPVQEQATTNQPGS